MKKLSLMALVIALTANSYASVAVVDKYAAEKNVEGLRKLMVNEDKAGEIRRAATIKLGKFQQDEARPYLQLLIKGESMGRDTRSEATRKEQQILAIKLLSQYGTGTIDKIMEALDTVEPVATRAELAVQVTNDMGPVYNNYLYKLAKEPELPAEQARMIINYLAPKAENDVKMCFFYYDIVESLANSGNPEKVEVANSVVSILPTCEARKFNNKEWLSDPRFVDAYDTAQTLRVPLDQKLAEGEDVTLEDAEPSINQLKAALEIDPANPLARYSIARIYQSLGMNEEALPWLNSVFPTASNWGIAYGLLCDVKFKLGKVREASVACEQAVNFAPSVPWHYYLQGNILKKRGKFQEAYNDYMMAVNMDKTNYEPVLAKDLEYFRKILEIDQR